MLGSPDPKKWFLDGNMSLCPWPVIASENLNLFKPNSKNIYVFWIKIYKHKKWL